MPKKNKVLITLTRPKIIKLYLFDTDALANKLDCLSLAPHREALKHKY